MIAVTDHDGESAVVEELTMRDSELYFVLAGLFALYLTWRIATTVRHTLKADRESERHGE